MGDMASSPPAAPGAGNRPALAPEIDLRFRGLRSLVGNTPILSIDFTFRGERRVL